MLDLVIFIHNNQLHTKENRKETASSSYLRQGSAHPSYTFNGIVKSQMHRLRRLCSRNEDYEIAIQNLKERCANSGYDMDMVGKILKDAGDIPREITNKKAKDPSDVCKIRWVTMSHSHAEKEIGDFVKKINAALRNQHIMFELIKTTAPTLGQLLFHNNNKKEVMELSKTCRSRCQVCMNGSRKEETMVKGSSNGETYIALTRKLHVETLEYIW